ncbi:MAG: hypothetical protein IVW51_09005 [Thermaceae bacterium]|nr:hypothetical protein [Thermaceae bacterium]
MEQTDPEKAFCVASPPTGQGPGILLLHAWWGLNGFFGSFVDRRAAEGLGVCLDLFGGKVAHTVGGPRALLPE